MVQTHAFLFTFYRNYFNEPSSVFKKMEMELPCYTSISREQRCSGSGIRKCEETF